ncbi:hypothetical protein HDU98_004269 [Podochytrium sp. JEL0797]|nr:hypothetical protein HDU98_004269 [Podochytrium sp. JEL0797]
MSAHVNVAYNGTCAQPLSFRYSTVPDFVCPESPMPPTAPNCFIGGNSQGFCDQNGFTGFLGAFFPPTQQVLVTMSFGDAGAACPPPLEPTAQGDFQVTALGVCQVNVLATMKKIMYTSTSVSSTASMLWDNSDCSGTPVSVTALQLGCATDTLFGQAVKYTYVGTVADYLAGQTSSQQTPSLAVAPSSSLDVVPSSSTATAPASTKSSAASTSTAAAATLAASSTLAATAKVSVNGASSVGLGVWNVTMCLVAAYFFV